MVTGSITAERVPPLRRNVPFQLLWTGSAVSALGSQLVAVAFPLLVLAVTGSPGTAGIVSAAQLAGMVAAAIPAGPLVDRWDRRRILLGCEMVRAGCAASVAAVVFTDRVWLPHLVLVALLLGATGALFTPARLVAVRAVVPPVQLRSALAQEEARGHAAGLAGPALGGALYSLGPVLPFLADAVSYLVSLTCITAARVPRRPKAADGAPPPVPADGLRSQFMEGLRWLRSQRFLRAVCTFSLALNMVASGLMLPVIVLINDRSGAPSVVGLVLSMSAVGGLIGALLAGRVGRLLRPGHLLLTFGWAYAALVCAMALPFGPFWPGLMLAIAALLGPALNVSLQASLLADTPDHMLGRVGSLLMVASISVAPVGPLMSGLLAEVLGPVGALIVIGGLLVVVSAVATAVPVFRRAPAAPGAPAAPAT